MRTTKTLLAVAAIAAMATPTAAIAKNGADDPPGHVRHSSQVRHHAKKHVRHHARNGADDGVNHARHGADDGPNHT